MRLSVTRFLAAMLLVVASLGIAHTQAPLTAAAQDGGTCTTGDTSQVRFYENQLGDTSDGNDYTYRCSNGTTMGTFNISGTCQGGVLFNKTWDECVSSFVPTIPHNQRFCIYAGGSYGGTLLFSYTNNNSSGSVQLARINLTGSANDSASSFRWVSTGTTC